MTQGERKIDETSAWQAFEKGEYLRAEKIWLCLLSEENAAASKDQLLSAYCYTLCKLRKYEEALKIYEDLYRKYGSPIYLRQMASVELERGNYQRALQYISEERVAASTRVSLPIVESQEQDD